MDFLAKHYEKLILAACLVCLIWYISKIDAQERQESIRTGDVSRSISSLVRADKLLEEKPADALPTLNQMLNVPAAHANFTTSPNGRNKPGFLDYGSYIICKGEDCISILPYSTDKCPDCETVQDPPAPEVLATDDLDKDGIPDLVEKEMLGINYRYPYDATEDFDGDGFTNYEEFLAQTDVNDAMSRPALAYLLRVDGEIKHNNLEYILERVSDGGGSPSKADWKVTFKYRGKSRAETLRLGNDVKHLAGYKLSDIAGDRTNVTLTNDKGDNYVMQLGKPTQEKGVSIPLTYLRSHDRYARRIRRTLAQMQKPEPKMDENAMNMGDPRGAGMMAQPARAPRMNAGMMNTMGMENASNVDPLYTFNVHEGDTFLLELTPSGQGKGGAMNSGMSFGEGGSEEIGTITEYYVVLPSVDGKVMVQQLNGEGGSPVGSPITVNVLDTRSPLSHDFIREVENKGENGAGMMPGAPRRGVRAVAPGRR